MRIRSLLSCVALTVALFHSGAAFAAHNLAIGSSSVGGTIHIMGQAMAGLLSEKVPDVYASVQNTPGPQTNMQLIETGEMKIGIVSNSVIHEAMLGEADWTAKRKFSKYRTILVLYASLMQWFVMDPTLELVTDLDGKTFCVGSPGGTPDVVGTAINDILGIRFTKNHGVISTCMDMLRDGRLDGMAATQGIPSPTYVDMQLTTEGHLVGMKPGDVEKAVAAMPYLSPAVIPANSYRRQPADLHTVALWNSVVVHEDLPDDVVYAITRACLENRDVFAAANASGKDFQAENIKFALGPIHRGAARYYKEIGIAVPEDSIR